MTRQHAEGAVAQVELMFGKNYQGSAREKLIDDMEPEGIEAMMDAMKALEREHSYLPSPIALLRLVRECGAAKADRRQVDRVRDRHKPDPQGFKVFQAMNRLFFSGKATRRQILEKLKEADSARPNAGWATCGAKLQQYYEKRGLDMDKPPHTAIDYEL